MMSSSRAKNFRRRSEDTEDDTNPSPTPKPTPLIQSQSTSSKPKANTAKPDSVPTRTRLSFADDEEEGDNDDYRPAVPRHTAKQSVDISSSTSQHKLTAAKDRLKSNSKGPVYSSTRSLPSNLRTQAGEYTKEKLSELKKNAYQLRTVPRPQQTTTKSLSSEPEPIKPNPPGEPVVVLKGLIKPMADSEKEEEREEEEEDGDSEKEREKVGSLPVIPDPETVKAIRAKRQQMQQPRHAAPDYISLDGGGLVSSRRQAGDMSSDEEEDEESQGRIAMYREPKKGVFDSVKETAPSMAEVSSVSALGFKRMELEEKEEDEEDEEERRWEEEQFRKALGRSFADTSSALAPPVPPSAYQSVTHQPSLVFDTHSAESMSISQRADVATRALQDNIKNLREVHKSSLNSLVRTDTHLSESLSEISSMEQSMEAASEKYVYMQELREYISVICDFLYDKAYYIEELEQEMWEMHRKRSIAISERRAVDVKDQSEEKKSKSKSNEPVELDEFGRDLNLKKRMDFARRAEGRKRRKARSESKRMSSIERGDSVIEGELSTDESDSEVSAYVSERDLRLQTADGVFSDASEEYSRLSIVKERLEGWKSRYPLTYRDAYASLSVPAVFTPFVRLELLRWDPLHNPVDFFDMEWHSLLFDYGQTPNGGDASDDADSDLIPKLVETVALPVLHHDLARCWDVLSTRGTENAVFATKMVIQYLRSESKPLHDLLAVVSSRLGEAASGLDMPAWGPANLAAYRFSMSVRLLKHVCLWKDVIAKPVLEQIAIDELLIGKILPQLKSMVGGSDDLHDVITRTERVVSSLSGLWAGPTRKLGTLVEFVGELGARLEKRRASEEEKQGLARRLKRILVDVNEYDRARAILRTFHLKEAL